MTPELTPLEVLALLKQQLDLLIYDNRRLQDENEKLTAENGRLREMNQDLLDGCKDALSYFQAVWQETNNHPASHWAAYVLDLKEVIEKAEKA